MKFIASLILLAFLPIFSVQAQTNDLDAAKQNLKDSYEKLVEVKGNKELTQVEKNKQELEAKKSAFKEVVDFSLAETQNAITKLKAIKNLDDNYLNLKQQILDTITNFPDYLKSYLIRLNDPKLAVDDLKKIALEFKFWRESVYDAAIKKALNFILVFRSADILNTASVRYSKIAIDLKLLKNYKSINQETLRSLFNDAASSLKEAAQLFKEAKEMLLLVTSTADVATSSISDSIATSTPEDQLNTPPDINDLIGRMLDDIKEAYAKFLEMSAAVKQATNH